MTESTVDNKRLGEIEGHIIEAFNKIRLRKVIISLQKFSAMQVKAKIVAAKQGMRLKDIFLTRW